MAKKNIFSQKKIYKWRLNVTLFCGSYFFSFGVERGKNFRCWKSKKTYLASLKVLLIGLNAVTFWQRLTLPEHSIFPKLLSCDEIISVTNIIISF